MHVELDVFSGRPNPTWALATEQADELARLHAALPATDARTSLPDGLGYRGFKIRGLRPFDEVIVWQATVQGEQLGQISQWLDQERTLEHMLVRTAEPHVDEAVLQTIRAPAAAR